MRHVRTTGHLGTVALYVASYLAIWTVVGIAAYTLYQPHGTAAAGGIVIAAGVYEITPLKRYSRVRCQECVRTGLGLGVMYFRLQYRTDGDAAGARSNECQLDDRDRRCRIRSEAGSAQGRDRSPAGGVRDVGLGVLIIASPTTVPGLMLPM